MWDAEHELKIAYSKEENAIVDRANQEQLRALLYKRVPLVQRILNTVEKAATGVNNSLQLIKRIFTSN